MESCLVFKCFPLPLRGASGNQKPKASTLCSSILLIQDFPQTKMFLELLSTESNSGKHIPVYQDFKAVKP